MRKKYNIGTVIADNENSQQLLIIGYNNDNYICVEHPYGYNGKNSLIEKSIEENYSIIWEVQYV